MKLLTRTWLASLVIMVLMFLDQIAGTETEDGGGMVVAVNGYITGKYCWPLLFTSAGILAFTTLALIARAGWKATRKA